MFVEHDPKHPKKVAVAATFAPSFDNIRSSGKVQFKDDEEPKMPAKLAKNGKDFHFVFVLDRSGSMVGENLTVTKKALKQFVLKLPVGCQFSLISFGSGAQLHAKFGELTSDSGVWRLTEEVREAII